MLCTLNKAYIMKKLYVCSFLALYSFTLFGAATSGANPQEQYKQALLQGNINAIVTAYAELPQENRTDPAIYAPFVRALLANKPTEQATIATLTQMYPNVQHPILKWVLRNDNTHLKELLTNLEQQSDKQHETMAYATRSPAIINKFPQPASPLQSPRALHTASKLMPTSNLPTTISKQSLQGLALDVIAKNLAAKYTLTEHIPTAENLAAIIKEAFTDKQLKQIVSSGRSKNEYITFEEELFNRLASIIANHYFLNIAGRKLAVLPQWLREQFIGVSIQDLLDHGEEFEVKDVRNRKVLDISGKSINDLTGLTNIPDIKTVHYLISKDNYIATIKRGTFAFANLRSLRRILLNNNRIHFIESGSFSGLKHLQYVDLSNNKIRTLAVGSLANIPSVVELNLSSNEITIIKRGSIANLPKLRRLNLSHNKMKSIEPGSIANLPLLKALYLDQNKITKITTESFAQLAQLEYLDLAYNRISTIERSAFAHLQQLADLLLSFNQLQAIEPGIFSDLASLKELKLDHNQISVIKLKSFNHLPSLLGLYLNYNQITAIASGVIENSPNLRVLNLEANQISSLEPGFAEQFPKLVEFNLDFNPIEQLGGAQINLPQFPGLPLPIHLEEDDEAQENFDLFAPPIE